MRTLFVLGALSALALLPLAGCGSSGAILDSGSGSAPTVAVTEPAEPVMISAVGGSVSITYTDEDADDVAQTDVFADRDGDLDTTADQVLIEGGRPELDGTPQTLLWTPSGVAPGLYRILAVTRDATSEVIDEAPAVVLLNASPTLTITEPSSDIVVSRGASTTIDIEYSDDDPDDAALTWITAELDCDEAHVDLLGCATSGPRDEMDGISQRLPLHVTPPSTHEEGVYTIVGTTWDGINDPVTATAPGRVEVRNVAWAKSAGGTDYPGPDGGEAIAAFADGSCVVAGYVVGSATFGAGEANETTLGSRGFVARYGADGTLSWAKSAGGTYTDPIYGIAAYADGSYVLTGNFSDSVTFGAGETNETTLTTNGLSDVFVARYGADGALSWAKAAGGTSYDSGQGIAARANGSCVVTGRFRYSATFGAGEANETTLTSAGSITPFLETSLFVASYGADGTLSWARNPGGTGGTSEGLGIAAHADGSSVVTGKFFGSVVFGVGEADETTLTSVGSVNQYVETSVFVASYGADGTLSWVKAAGGMARDSGHGIAAHADGSCVVTGRIEGSATFGAGEANETTLTPAGSINLFVASYGADGALRWVKASGGRDAYGEGQSIAAHADGSCVVTGLFAGVQSFGAGEANATTLTWRGTTGLLVARYGADGTLSWVKTADGTQRGSGRGIVALADGSCVVTGRNDGNGSATYGAGEANETTLRTTGTTAVFVARYNADGGF